MEEEKYEFATPFCTPIDSRLIDIDSLNFLTEEGFQGRQVRLELLYRGSTHGFNSADFHGLCDGKGPTLTVIQSNSDNVFGGFTSQSWGIAPGFVSYQDSQAWLF